MRSGGARRCETWRRDMWRDLRRRNMRGWRRNARSRGKTTSTTAPAAMGSGGKAAATASTSAAAKASLLLRAFGGRKRSGNEKESGKRTKLRTHGFRAPHRAPFLKRLTDTRVSKDFCRQAGIAVSQRTIGARRSLALFKQRRCREHRLWVGALDSRVRTFGSPIPAHRAAARFADPRHRFGGKGNGRPRRRQTAGDAPPNNLGNRRPRVRSVHCASRSR